MMWLEFAALMTLVGSVLSRYSCPPDAVNQVFLCISNVTTGIHDEGKKMGSDSHSIKRICRTKEFQTAIDCVEKLFSDCRNKTDLVLLLKKLADPVDIHRSFDLLCKNVDFYVASSPCMMEQDHKIQPCSRRAEEDFNRTNGKTETVYQEIAAFCRFQSVVSGCILRPVTAGCGDRLGNLLNSFMTGVTSPVCREMATNGAHPNLPSTTLWIVLFANLKYFLMSS